MGKSVYLKDPAGPAIWGSSPQAAATPSFLPLAPAAPSSPLAWMALLGFGRREEAPGAWVRLSQPCFLHGQPQAVRAFIQRWGGPGWFVVIY